MNIVIIYIIEYLKNPIIFGLCVALIMVFLSFLDAKISKKEKTKLDYFKVFISTGVVSGSLQFLIKKSFTSLQNGGKNEEVTQDISEENISESIAKNFKSKKMHTDLPSW